MKKPEKKMTWKQYAKALESYVEYLKSQPDSYNQIVEKVKEYSDLKGDSCIHLETFGDGSNGLYNGDNELIESFGFSTPSKILAKLNQLISEAK